MIEIIKIPDKRKAVLIGKKGGVRKRIEELLNVKINVGDDVSIDGDVIGVLKAKDIVMAIGRGFSPDKALALLDEDYRLEIVSLSGKNKNALKRIIARVIGRKGTAKKKIEIYTHTNISVYGKTIAMIGKWDNVERARKAIDMLVDGKTHQYVFSYLKRSSREIE
ncbi:MAG TPA: RNA-processing protein [Candidatus Aenigmarchaeota archaeon]|nr:MAG: RNA-processing protein [Candidatus Aenigmarchaeota archaeon]HDD46196.1 RNA-processing protein [Candidatus Aenigmarchaeota archaeon]